MSGTHCPTCACRMSPEDIRTELAEWADREELWALFVDELNRRLHVLENQSERAIKQLTGQLIVAEQELDVEKLYRVSAQQGRADDIRTPCYSCGEPWRPPLQREIGYEPKQDRAVRPFFANQPLRRLIHDLLDDPTPETRERTEPAVRRGLARLRGWSARVD